MRVAILSWVSGLVLISSVASADPLIPVGDQQKLCAATAELLGAIRMEARLPADVAKMKNSTSMMELEVNFLRAESKLEVREDHLKVAKAISGGASFVDDVVRDGVTYQGIRLPMDLTGETGPAAYARMKLRQSRNLALDCKDEGKEFVCAILKPSGKITNKIAAIFRAASKKGPNAGASDDGGSGAGSGIHQTHTATTDKVDSKKLVTKKKSTLTALKKCPGYASLLSLENLGFALDRYKAEAHGVQWFEYHRFEFSLPMGEKSMTDDAAQKILKVDSSGTQNGLKCSNTKIALTCSFGVDPSTGRRYKVWSGVHDVVTRELAAKTAKVKAGCGKKDTVFEENKDAPAKQGQDAV